MPPRQRVPAISPALEAVCLKALAKRREERYGSAKELAQEIERFLAYEPLTAFREPWRARARRWMRRHRTLVSGSVAALVVATLSSGLGMVFLKEANDREHDLRQTAERQRDEANRLRNEVARNLYISQMNLVQRAYEENDISYVRDLLDIQIPQDAEAPDFRHFEWHYWYQRLSHRAPFTINGHEVSVTSVAWSADDKRIVSGSEDKTLKVWDAATGQETLTLKGHTNAVTSVAWSGDGKRIVSGSKDKTSKCGMP